ncbi:hypothetical protein DEO72_LG8g2424 [Vigna unguiculata]|uniref:LisH domain-containing protein n=1 Tax=Vigna unguiculata TaxID=3917 RepID=A0A4D6MTG6_VIGUN|nr:hypothetical protein DEO72_LG8g2424 [Vigna unguiculata]
MTSAMDNVSQPLVTFIVDQYLCRNQFYQTRATFRNEALPLFAARPSNTNVLSLEEILNQYILLKKQHTRLEEEKVMVMQEKNRIQKLLQDIQNGMVSFNAISPMSNVKTIITNSAIARPVENSIRTPPVASSTIVFPMQNTMSLPIKPTDNKNLSSPMIGVFDKKRKDISTANGSVVAKKPRGRKPGKKKQLQCTNMSLSSPNNNVDFGSSDASPQSLVINPTNKETHISTNYVSTTHPIIHSFPIDTHVTPVAKCNGEVIAPSYNVITTRRDMVDHVKQMACNEGNIDFSSIVADNDETQKRDTNKESNMDTNKTSTRTLDVNSSDIPENLDPPFSNEIVASEFDNKRDDCIYLDFSEDMLDFINFEE